MFRFRRNGTCSRVAESGRHDVGCVAAREPRGMTQGKSGESAPGPLLVADGVTLQYKTADHLVTATWRVGFEVFAGERFVVLGPSGCGKSTLLKAIAGFMP